MRQIPTLGRYPEGKPSIFAEEYRKKLKKYDDDDDDESIQTTY